ncbi:type III pantothenate kinase [Prochlorococcus sp. MIT 1223]|uniref:type III pantothenate kinase n=1 Tax=Prochlorococcus sp. MIT 1223 TaxID=3096217 RepID=UPI002A760D09|nr:type III pantothenate kinase [Prochlorococcus sp. MIT 1223]
MKEKLDKERVNKKTYLLIGNSRLHWAFQNQNQWDFLDTSIKQGFTEYINTSLLAWAEVGKRPKNIYLDPKKKLNIEEIPLLNVPSWLGIDRALAGWGAFKKAKELSIIHTNGLLIADAGTVLSITRISKKGEFIGGQLIAGLNLQLKAMAQCTNNLSYPSRKDLNGETFPKATEDAMLRGSFQSLIGAIQEAKKDTSAPLFICGGDSLDIFNKLKISYDDIYHCPNLVLEGMINVKHNELT